ncbi:MAG: hypothetical protein M3281_08905, partial [Chloroflexota bacterium]|nr:hypothetical protein [Chloroflexota bacterium]
PCGRARLATHSRPLDLPLQPLPYQTRTGWPPAERLDREFPWRATMAERGARTEVQAFGMGDIAIVAVAAEPFAQTGLSVKAASPFEPTVFAGYTNGCIGYVPTPDAYPHRGYEIDVSYIGFRLPDPVAPQGEALLVEACLAALAEVRGRR